MYALEIDLTGDAGGELIPLPLSPPCLRRYYRRRARATPAIRRGPYQLEAT